MPSPLCMIRRCIHYDDFMRPGSSQTLSSDDPEHIVGATYRIGDSSRKYYGVAYCYSASLYDAHILTRRSFGTDVTIRASIRGYTNLLTDSSGYCGPYLTFRDDGTSTRSYQLNFRKSGTNLLYVQKQTSATSSTTLLASQSSRPLPYPNDHAADLITYFASCSTNSAAFVVGADGYGTASISDSSGQYTSGAVGMRARKCNLSMIKNLIVYENTRGAVDFWMRSYGKTRASRIGVVPLFDTVGGRVQQGPPEHEIYEIRGSFIHSSPRATMSSYADTIHWPFYSPMSNFDTYEERLCNMVDNNDLVWVKTPAFEIVGFVESVEGPTYRAGTNREVADFTLRMRKAIGFATVSYV